MEGENIIKKGCSYQAILRRRTNMERTPVKMMTAPMKFQNYIKTEKFNIRYV